jgi:argininosuccinate lyase
MMRLWDKGAPLDARVLEFTAGEDHALDDRLVAHDVEVSIAHADALHAAGLLTAADRDAIRDALREIGASHARGEWRVTLELEDGQTALEARLTEKLGATGGRLHAGRSRNDQVLAALRLYLRTVVEQLVEGAEGVALALDRLAERQGAIALPGYTHMQQAMPSSVALWAGGFAAEIRDDAEGLRQCLRRIDRNPLGSAAGYGTPNLPIDRELTRAALGFAANHEPVTAVQLSRGKAEATVAFEIALLMQDLGRLASDVLLFYTREFGFVTLPEAFTTGSSIMPQKRNPDVFELVRARTATALDRRVPCLARHHDRRH